MATLVFGMNVSLDGYVDHTSFGPPGLSLFRHYLEQTRGLAGSIYGRGLYEAMQFWDGEEWMKADPAWLEPMREFAEAWRRQPKWVVSRSLTSVGPNATLVREDFAEVVRRLKSQLEGRIDVGGPKLAASLTKLGLVDEYQLHFRPFVLGRGNPFFASAQPPLRLVASDRIGEDVMRLTYRPA